jgi:hypothetical protein
MAQPRRQKTAKKQPSLADDAAGIQRLLGILGYTHLRARVARAAVLVESGPSHDPHVHLRLRSYPGENWRADVPTRSRRWQPLPYVGPRGNMVAWINQDFPWLFSADPSSAG